MTRLNLQSDVRQTGGGFDRGGCYTGGPRYSPRTPGWRPEIPARRLSANDVAVRASTGRLVYPPSTFGATGPTFRIVVCSIYARDPTALTRRMSHAPRTFDPECRLRTGLRWTGWPASAASPPRPTAPQHASRGPTPSSVCRLTAKHWDRVGAGTRWFALRSRARDRG